MQNEPDLARLFNVSREAIRTRLSQTGIVAPTPRCQGQPGRYRHLATAPPGQLILEIAA
jgi:hypothetical protein